MAAREAGDYYYDEGRSDYMNGRYNQPFPPPLIFDIIDEFELHCNIAYIKGYNDERDGRANDSFSLS